MLETAVIAAGILAILMLGYYAFAGANPGKASQRRLEQVRYRHSDSTENKVEAQLKKAVAARKPKMHKIAGSSSRAEALALRLDRTGKGWTTSQYLYTSFGLTLLVGAIVFLRTGAPLLALGVGAVIGFGLPHMVVNFSSRSAPTSSPPNSPTQSSFWCAVCVRAFQ